MQQSHGSRIKGFPGDITKMEKILHYHDMNGNTENILITFLADTHLGFDLPIRPRVFHRRRGDDFFANYNMVIHNAIEKKAEMIIHGGDLFFKKKVHPAVIEKAFEPLIHCAEKGIKVVIVPGNHERSQIPQTLFTQHKNILVFQEPRTFCFTIKNMTIALSGFPYYYKGIRKDFHKVLKRTGWENNYADIRLLCMHHIVAGSKVGPSDYTFRYGKDVINTNDLPVDFNAVLSGHIHRHQVLVTDLAGNHLKTPVLYPGAIERTSIAEQSETKGYLDLRLTGKTLTWSFITLPARPMHRLCLDVTNMNSQDLKKNLKKNFENFEKDAVVRIFIKGTPDTSLMPLLNAEFFRHMAGPERNIHFTGY